LNLTIPSQRLDQRQTIFELARKIDRAEGHLEAALLNFGEIKHIVEASTKLITLLTEKRAEDAREKAQVKTAKADKDQLSLGFGGKGLKAAFSRLWGPTPAHTKAL